MDAGTQFKEVALALVGEVGPVLLLMLSMRGFNACGALLKGV